MTEETQFLSSGVLPARWEERCCLCYGRGCPQHRKREPALRGRKSEDSFSEELLFAPDPEEQVGRKNGKNAVLPTRSEERSGSAAEAQGVC